MKKKFTIGATLKYQLKRSLTEDSRQASGSLSSVLVISTMSGQKLVIETCYLSSIKEKASWCLS